MTVVPGLNLEVDAFDAAGQKAAIELAVDHLRSFDHRTRIPSPEPQQYVGTVVSNTAMLLIAVLNALDGGQRKAIAGDVGTWLSLNQAVYRSFFTTLLLAVERAFAMMCADVGLVAVNRQQRKTEQLIKEMEQLTSGLQGVDEVIQRLRRSVRSGGSPGFMDYLETVLAASSMPKSDKKTWRAFFDALTILRNKSSHSDPTLTEGERERLIRGGCEVMIDANGALISNADFYAQVVRNTLNFLDRLALSPPQAAAAAQTNAEGNAAQG